MKLRLQGSRREKLFLIFLCNSLRHHENESLQRDVKRDCHGDDGIPANKQFFTHSEGVLFIFLKAPGDVWLSMSTAVPFHNHFECEHRDSTGGQRCQHLPSRPQTSDDLAWAGTVAPPQPGSCGAPTLSALATKCSRVMETEQWAAEEQILLRSDMWMELKRMVGFSWGGGGRRVEHSVPG